MKNYMKALLIPGLAAMLVTGIIGLSVAGEKIAKLIPANEFVAGLMENLKELRESHPEERVYLHFDKPFYKPGESVWFQAYLRDGKDFKASTQSDIIHVELINPKGSVEKHIKLVAKKGLASGDFYLEENAAGGLYKVKAYTNWQKNEVNAPIFEKELTVQAVTLPRLKMKIDFERKAYGKGDNVTATVSFHTLENQPLADKQLSYVVNLDGKKILEQKSTTSKEGEAFIEFQLPQDLASNDGLLNVMISHEGNTESISRSIPIVLNKIDFTLYPEGGDLVSGLESKVAFRALNEDGKPADIEGFVEDSKGNKVCDIQSFHFGMGAFNIKPEKGEKYFVSITRPKNITEKFALPEAFERGYTLNVLEIKKDEILLNISSSENEDLSLICTVRDEVYYTTGIKAGYGANTVKIPLADFPIGVTKITLFDKKGIERAERLAFVNKHKQLKVSVETDKEKYLPREKVKMTLKVTDERGMPMPGNFSVSVADDKLLSFADDRSGNILSKLLLEYDIKEKVEEPGFYFDSKEENADQALDYLMMTSGWRRFTWKQITEKELPAIQYPAEKAVIAGTVFSNGKPLPKAKVEISGKNLSTTTDAEGRYSFRGVELYNAITLSVSASGLSTQSRTLAEYSNRVDFHLYDYDKVYYRSSGINKGNRMKKADRLEEMEMMMGEMPKDALIPQMAPVPDNIAGNANVFKLKKEENKKELVADKVILWEDDIAIADTIFFAKGKVQNNKPVAPQTYYYRAREFSSPIYDKEEKVEMRTDFRSTIYWNGNIETDRSGKAVLEFYNSDEISSFRVVAEGISADGMLGRTEKTYFTQLPFAMTVKAPVEVTAGDDIAFPLTLKNNTANTITGKLSINIPEGLELTKEAASSYTIASKEAKTIYLNFRAKQVKGVSKLQLAFHSEGLSDAFSQDIKVSPRGFPTTISFSGNELEKEYVFTISSPVEGSLEANFTAYPSVVSDLMQGIEGIIREPYGCFEQTSTSNYPNLLIKKYIQNTQGGQQGQGGNKKMKMPEGLDSKLEKGYGRLVSYETKEKGYEWFGGTPAHEALSAYGLMQFNDMKDVYEGVDDAMVSRTSNWLLSRRDGKGGFLRSAQALDRFGRASEEVTNAYIVYALSEAGTKGIDKEAMNAHEKAMTTKDAYLVALTANTMLNLKKANESKQALKVLTSLQTKEGSWTGASHSITRSMGQSLVTETSSLAMLALLKSPEGHGDHIRRAADFIVAQRSGYGDFGSTQATVLALKALTAYAEYSRRTDEAGSIEIYVNGNKVSTLSYESGQRDPLSVKKLEKYLKEGKNKVKVKYIGARTALPYSFSIGYHSRIPNSSEQCKVALKTSLAAGSAKTGETVRMSAVLTNKTQEGLPMTMVILGIPAGLSAQPWQLKELQEKAIFDFYEIRENRLIIYYRQMEPEQKREINLDLKAEIPGEFEGSASCAYLYYGNEHKVWTSPEKISIKP